MTPDGKTCAVGGRHTGWPPSLHNGGIQLWRRPPTAEGSGASRSTPLVDQLPSRSRVWPHDPPGRAGHRDGIIAANISAISAGSRLPQAASPGVPHSPTPSPRVELQAALQQAAPPRGEAGPTPLTPPPLRPGLLRRDRLMMAAAVSSTERRARRSPASLGARNIRRAGRSRREPPTARCRRSRDPHSAEQAVRRIEISGRRHRQHDTPAET